MGAAPVLQRSMSRWPGAVGTRWWPSREGAEPIIPYGTAAFVRLRSKSVRRGSASRKTKARRDELRRRAAEYGVSVQAYLEAKAFDEPFQELSHHARPRHQKERLPLTG